MRVVFVRLFVLPAAWFFRATGVSRVVAGLLVAGGPVVVSRGELLAVLLGRVRGAVLVVPWLLPAAVPVVSPFLYVVIRNREGVHGVLDGFLVLLRSVSQGVPARAIGDAGVPV